MSAEDKTKEQPLHTRADLRSRITELEGEEAERKRAEEAVRAASTYARNLIEASLDPLVTISPDGKITDVNEATVKVTGVPRAQLIGSDFSAYFTEPKQARAGYQQVLAQGAVRDYPLAIRHVSGQVTDVLYNATVYRNQAGEIEGVFAAARDVTEHKRAEEELEKYRRGLEAMVADRTASLEAASAELQEVVARQEALLREAADTRKAMLFMLEDLNEGTATIAQAKKEWEATFDAIADPLFIHDRAFRIVRANQAYADAAGMPPAELIGKLYYEVFPKREGPFKKCLKAMEQVVRTEEEEEEEEQVPCPIPGKIYRTRIFSRRGSAGKYVHSIHVMEDITERKQAHEALKDMLGMLQALIQASPEAITITETDGRIRVWNPGAERIFGWREEEVLGLPLPTTLAGPEEEYRAFCARVLGGDTFTDSEFVRQRKDGAYININLSAAPLRDARGRTWGIMSLITDITERKLLEAQAKRTDRLTVLGQLLGGIAHELKNPLFVVTGRLQLMKEKLAGREYGSLENDLQRVEEAARRMTTTTQRFLSLARPMEPHWSTCSIQAILDSLLEFIGHELMKSRIQVVKSFAPDLPETWTEPQQLNEAFMNLVLNAMQAMTSARGKGTLTIATTGEDGWIAVRIQDDGPGIAPEHMAKLFEPFFTTKPPDVGTGLGLWTVRTTLAALDGTIGCESELGRGAIFTVRIPIVAAPTKT